MILRFFRSSQPITILAVPAFIILIWTILIVNTNQTPGQVNLYPNPAFEIFPLLFLTKNYFFLLLVPPILILINAMYFANILVRHMIIQGRTQLPAFFYLVLAIPSVFQSTLVPWNLFASFFFLLTIDILFGQANKKGLSFRFLDGGIFFAIGSIFDYSLLYFIPFLLLIQLHLRSLNWREMLYIIIGFVLPYLLIFSFLFLTDINLQLVKANYAQLLELRVASIYSQSEMIFYGIVLLSIIISSLYAMSLFPKFKIYIRKYLQLFFILFLNSIIATLMPISGKELFIYMAIPISFVFSLYFASCRTSWFNQVLFLLNIFGASVVAILSF